MSRINTISRLLAGTALFKGLSEAELLACAASFREVSFAKGEMLFARGDAGFSLYLIADGRVRLAIVSSTGRELSFRHATAGDILGEIAALDGGPRTADAIALTPVTAYSLERSALRRLLSTNPSILTAMVVYLCQKLRDTSEQLETIALHALETRLARFLLIALGNRQPLPGKRIPLELKFSQEELAKLLGASRPKVNTALGVLESAGAIHRTLDQLYCDPAKLSQIAEAGDV
ncbi:MAG: Crp/Fnr family transcriptional regulator [Hyphomicrobiales bacterium]|nr:Crp/Fnr family transcriptional regulator [Hyphomicrobiales bacterium]MBV9518040.1 Crp/Fnr family transcriptional regulator [Hyphomicrobiales bacterium]